MIRLLLGFANRGVYNGEMDAGNNQRVEPSSNRRSIVGREGGPWCERRRIEAIPDDTYATWRNGESELRTIT